MPASSAAVKPGSKCLKVGTKQTLNGLTFTCKKSGSKLAWSQGVKEQLYDATFARAHLLEAQERARQILADAKIKADQISSPPNCTTRNSTASVVLGADGMYNLLSLVFNNSGICDLTVRASAAFLCPDGKVQKTSNYVTSTGIFPLTAGEKLSVNVNISNYFPQVLTECRSLTGYSSNLVNISTYHQSPSVMTLTSTYSGNFNQMEATKKANQHLASEKVRADKLVTDAKNPISIAKAWKAAADAKVAAEIQALEDAKVAAEAKAAVEKAAVEKAAAEKAAIDEIGKVCAVENNCKVGNIGPGGGIVFYDAGSRQSWGRYLEVAPKGWYGSTSDPRLPMCNVSFAYSSRLESIGSGKLHTDAIVAACTSGAAVAARTYKGGGKSDWSLPSVEELNQLYQYLRIPTSGNLRQSFAEHVYLSSTAINSTEIWTQSFLSGGRNTINWITPLYVRPVRTF